MMRGEVWLVNLDPVIGAEIRKSRPCVIVSRDAFALLPFRIVVPVTAWDNRFAVAPWHVPIERTRENGLRKKSSADTFQVRSIADQRLIKKVGRLEDTVMNRIDAGLALCLALA
jgi:mRNA interferase MazF